MPNITMLNVSRWNLPLTFDNTNPGHVYGITQIGNQKKPSQSKNSIINERYEVSIFCIK